MKILTSRAVLPGFKTSFTLSLFWIGVMVILPFAMLLLTTLQLEWNAFWQTISNRRVIASILLSFEMASLATAVNLIFGTLIAWVLVRYDFKGKSILNALIDLPFALPTAVAGIVLANLYAPNGLFGQWFALFDIKIAFTPLGIAIALVFVSFPFTVRTVQPVLSQLDGSIEEAATTLGANRFTILRRIILPALYPAMIGGAGMGLARSLGDYGSVIFIAGNIPMVSEIAPLIIMSKLDIYDMQGASTVAFLMLLISFLLLFLINLWQWYLNRRYSLH